MSDKFFFKGRQDARQNYTKYDSGKKENTKAGSQKYPLNLIVTSEAREEEVQALVTNAGLYASITVDTSSNAVESIAELSEILSRATTVKVSKTPQRNDPCSCGSGKKYKKCCANIS